MQHRDSFGAGCDESPRALPLVILIAILAGSGLVLHAIAGPPHLPSHVPSVTQILITLQGSDVPLAWFADAFTSVAWVLWFWMVGSLLLQLVTAVVELVTRGAAWAKGVHGAIDRLTVPLVRRAVDGAVVAVVVAHLVTRAPSAAAAPLHPTTVLVGDTPDHQLDRAVGGTDHRVSATRPANQPIEYTVQPGDTLWSIAERFYGTGADFPRLVEANAGRRMPDGNVFTRAGVIQPGWVLVVPSPRKGTKSEGEQSFYVVKEGDTLRGIAARLLGDENRWPEIYDVNRGTARLSDGRVLTDPDLIWPGLRMRLPVDKTVAHPLAPAVPIPKHTHPVAPSRETRPAPIPAPRIAPVVTAPIVSPSATPTRSIPAPTPTIVRAPITTPPRASASPFESPLVEGAAVAAFAAAGAVVLARRSARRSLDEPADATTPPPLTLCNDFAATDLARSLAHRLESGEIEPVEVVAAQARRFFRARGIGDVAILLARQAPKATSLRVALTPPDGPALAAWAQELGERLGGQGRAALTAEGDVIFKLDGLKLARLAFPVEESASDRPLLVPLGLLVGGDTLSLGWDALNHVLITGQPGGGSDVVLTTLLVGLATRRRPSELRLITIARRHGLSPHLGRLPHHVGAVVDLDDADAVARALRMARGELVRRMARDEPAEAWRPSAEEPSIVLAIDDLADVEDDGTTLELLGSRGAAHGITLLAATAHADEIGDDLLVHFPTRLVLQTLDDAGSIRLLGRPDAVDLGSAEILARVAGRPPLRVRGFQIPHDHLEALVTLLRDAYGEPCVTAVGGDARDETAEGARDDDQSAADECAETSDDEPDGDDENGADAEGVEEQENAADADDVEPRARQRSFADLVGASAQAGPPAALAEALHWNGQEARAERAAMALGTADDAKVEPVEETSRPGEPATPPSENQPRDGDGVAGLRDDGGAVEDGANDDVSDRRHPIQVRCFGRFRVTSGRQELNPTLNGRSCHKAWELLALLAARPDGAIPKDQLLAALWPDTDEEYAIQNLHQTGSRLRRSLRVQVSDVDDSVVSNGRDGIYRLDPAQVWSDAQRFAHLCGVAPTLPRERAIAALHQARRLYRGELLADQAYKWPMERYAGTILRAYYADLYRKATCRMARLLCEDGHPTRAVALYKGLLKREPTLEDVVCGLFRCYQQLGDLGALLREEHELRQALRAAYGEKKTDAKAGEPSASTRALFQQIRAELEARGRGEKSTAASPLNGKVARGW